MMSKRGWHSAKLAVVSGRIGLRKSPKNTREHAFASLEKLTKTRQIAEPRDKSGNSGMPMAKT